MQFNAMQFNAMQYNTIRFGYCWRWWRLPWLSLMAVYLYSVAFITLQRWGEGSIIMTVQFLR